MNHKKELHCVGILYVFELLKNSIKFLLVAGAGGIVLVIALAVMMIVKR